MANVVWPVDKVGTEPEYASREARQAMSAALGGATAARPLGARSGVRPGTPTTTVALPTATSYVIHPHAGILDLQTSGLAGPYWYAIPADETGTVTAAHGTWPRKDILWIRVDDPAEAGTDPPALVTGYTAGTAAASPAVPATPARSMRLATITIPQSGGGAPTIVFDATLLESGIIPCRTIAERDALTTSATAENPIYADVAGVLWTCNDAATWVMASAPLLRLSNGRNGGWAIKPATARPIRKVFGTTGTTSAGGVLTVTFPVEPAVFTVNPIVQATTASGTAVAAVINSGAVTTTNVQIAFPGVASTVVDVNVTAEGW